MTFFPPTQESIYSLLLFTHNCKQLSANLQKSPSLSPTGVAKLQKSPLNLLQEFAKIANSQKRYLLKFAT
jgi:hypothetical protein